MKRSIGKLPAVPIAAPVLLAMLLAMPARQSAAATIISEDFNRANGTNMSGATPDVADLPGGTFSVSTTGWTAQAEGNQLQIGADIALDAPLGIYTAGVLQVSASIELGNLVGTLSDKNRGVALGFNSVVNGAWNNFTGLRLSPDGYLVFESNGTYESTVAVSVNSSTTYQLSYDVNLGTGVLSNISLSGVSADFSSIVTASQASNYFSGDTNLSVFAGGSGAGQYGYVDNLVLSNSASTPVPEPASMALLGTALAALGLARRRRQA